jgi:hypothetical protein
LPVDSCAAALRMAYSRSSSGAESRSDTARAFFPPSRQGLTLVHFRAQLERFVWDRECA